MLKILLLVHCLFNIVFFFEVMSASSQAATIRRLVNDPLKVVGEFGVVL